MNSLRNLLPQELLTSPAAIAEARKQLDEERQRRHVERARENADEIREQCRHMDGFFREAWSQLEPSTELRWNWHLDCFCEHLEALSRGQLHPRIIFNVPPGCSKSTAVSVIWNAYEWGPLNKRGVKFLSTSYEIGNVARDTRKTRDLILSEWFQTLWPVELTRRGELDFETKEKGTRVGVPFSSLTAKRGDRLTIDDPHSLDGAESEVERTKAVRRFIEGGQNRLNDAKRSIIAVVMQRLHERDLTGEILSHELGYEHVMLPMEFEPARKCYTSLGWEDPRTEEGELLDPVRFPKETLAPFKLSQYAYAGQYQQRPAPREGGMFKVDEILKVDFAPHGCKRVRGWDIAGSTRKTSPFTAGLRLAYDHGSGILYIEDCVRRRAEIADAEALIVSTARDDGKSVEQSLPQDPGQAGKSQKVHLSNKLMGLNFSFSPESGTKEDRAIPVASMVNSGMVRMVRGDWNSALEEEMRNFPASAYKDQVDALSRAFSAIARYMGDDDRPLVAPIIPAVIT